MVIIITIIVIILNESENLTSRLKSDIQVSLIGILRQAINEWLYFSKNKKYCKPFPTMTALNLFIFPPKACRDYFQMLDYGKKEEK